MWVYGLGWAGPGQRKVADACECGNEPSGSVKCGEFLDWLQTGQLLKKDSAPWMSLPHHEDVMQSGGVCVLSVCNLRQKMDINGSVSNCD